jgi:hypothetical protein
MCRKDRFVPGRASTVSHGPDENVENPYIW